MGKTPNIGAQVGFAAAFGELKARSQKLRSEPLGERVKRLKKLEKWVRDHTLDIEKAVFLDLGKPAMEVGTSEIFPTLAEIQHALTHLRKWTRPKPVDAPITFLGTRSEIRYEPKGTCLIISPWNYPFQLSIAPLVSCLAAGNSALLKPSEFTPNTAALISRLVKEVFEGDLVVAVEGDASVSTELLKLPFDHIFFTGSPAVGKVVMRAAADQLSSVTLELGGKSPAIIDRTASLRDAAKRIALGKFLNSGQTCIAPDYLLVERSVCDEFLELLQQEVKVLFGRGEAITTASVDYSRIVSERHFLRLDSLVKDALAKGAKLFVSGSQDATAKFYPPTILTQVNNEMLVMQEEIFGPVLPVLTFDSEHDVVEMINGKPKPLALYVFSYRKAFREFILKETSAGGVCINDCVIQFIHPNLPFGGVNNSGIGKSHGYAGFLAFSNEKPVVRQKRGLSNAYLFYPPYTSLKRRILDVVLRWFL